MLDRLVENYRKFISLPWASNLPDKQKVWFAAYPPAEERRLRAIIQEFEAATLSSGHSWRLADITHEPALWIARHDYGEKYFAEPAALANIEEDLRSDIVMKLSQACEAEGVNAQTVVAILGIGSLFGLTHVSGIVAGLEKAIRGRLLVFFPGTYEKNQYRFMDARDGFDYMAVPITCGERAMS